jgi:hypothetical protein
MIRLHIVSTFKSYSPKSEWTQGGVWDEDFPSIKAAKEGISDRYGKSRRRPVYRDTKDGREQVGFVVGFRVEGMGTGDKYLEQDWITFYECKEVDPS